MLKGRATRERMPEMKLILDDLQNGPANRHDLAAITRLKPNTIYSYLRVASNAGWIRIVGYERERYPIPIYGLKTSPMQRNAPKPPPLPDTLAKRQWRAKQMERRKDDQQITA